MTFLFFLFTLITCSLAILFTLFPRHFSATFVFTLFAIAFGFTVKTTDYIGYALDSSFIADGSEALVLSLTETIDSFYVVVQFKDEEPRLIKIVKKGNSEMDNSAAAGNKVLRFGGGGNEIEGKGDGEESMESGVEVIDLNESSEFRKGE